MPKGVYPHKKRVWTPEMTKQALQIIANNPNNLRDAFREIAIILKCDWKKIAAYWYGSGSKYMKNHPLHQARLNGKVFMMVGTRELPANRKNFSYEPQKKTTSTYIESVYELIRRHM